MGLNYERLMAYRPADIAVDPDNGDVYIADGYGNARVHRFSADGELIQSWGEPGTGPGQFYIPHGIAVAADGRVFVCDRESDRIQIFSPDGEYLSEWTDTQRPTHLVFDAAGTAYVSELWWHPGQTSRRHGVTQTPKHGRVSVFDRDGRLLARWGTPEATKPGSFAAPHGLAVDSKGDVYVGEVTWTFAVSRGLAPVATGNLHCDISFGGRQSEPPPQLRLARNTLLRRTGTNEQRGLTRALINVRGVPLDFYNTHLHTTAADRLMQSPKLYATFLLWLLAELFETLPEEGDLRVAGRHERGDFFQDFRRGTAPLAAARERHDAKRAELAAALNHRDVRLEPRSPGDVPELVNRGLERQLERSDALSLGPDLFDDFADLLDVARAEDEVDPGGTLQNFLAFDLRDAPGHPDDEPGRILLLPTEHTERAVNLGLGFFAHRARIENHDVRGLVAAPQQFGLADRERHRLGIHLHAETDATRIAH